LTDDRNSASASNLTMATYLLLHGAGSDSWYWHRVVPLLEQRGHAVVAPDLPCDDDTASFDTYADVAVAAVGDRRDLVVVAQSLAGFTAPIVCERVPVDLLVLLAAMVPTPGESAGDWWASTRWEDYHGPMADPFDPVTEFFHDVPADITAEAMAAPPRRQSNRPFEEPWPLASWPDVPTRFLLCRDDRFFPAAFQRCVVQERLGIVPDEMDGGHLVALARPAELVERLEGFRS
jgi:pimeloyl-ACP methyl ester carboxylesterase